MSSLYKQLKLYQHYSLQLLLQRRIILDSCWLVSDSCYVPRLLWRIWIQSFHTGKDPFSVGVVATSASIPVQDSRVKWWWSKGKDQRREKDSDSCHVPRLLRRIWIQSFHTGKVTWYLSPNDSLTVAAWQSWWWTWRLIPKEKTKVSDSFLVSRLFRKIWIQSFYTGNVDNSYQCCGSRQFCKSFQKSGSESCLNLP